MDQLKLFRESSLKKRIQHEQTSQKKYGFKYYDYCGMVPNRHRIAQSILVHSVCQPKIKPINLHKSLNVNKKTVRNMNDSNSTVIGPQKDLRVKEYSLNQELRYYKVICKNLRKENIILKNQQQILKKKQPKTKKKKIGNKQNIDQSRYHQLLKQLSVIQSQLSRPDVSTKNSYKAFYLNFVKSLKEINIEEPSNQQQALKKWRQIIEAIQKNNIN